MQAVATPVSAQLRSRGSLLLFNHYAVTPDMAGGTRHYDIGKALAARAGEVKRIALNAERARHELGWKPTVSLEDGLDQTLTWVSSVL